MTNDQHDIREHKKDYELYADTQRKAGVVPVEYDVWAKNELARRREKEPKAPRKMSTKDQTRTLRLKGDLVTAKNRYYDEIAGIIWNKRGYYNSWQAQKAGIDECLNELRLKMQTLIDESGLE